MSGSAATTLVAIAERDYRLVRDEFTGVVYAIPAGGGDPTVLANLEKALALTYYREHSKVAASGARRDAMAVLGAMDVRKSSRSSSRLSRQPPKRSSGCWTSSAPSAAT